MGFGVARPVGRNRIVARKSLPSGCRRETGARQPRAGPPAAYERSDRAGNVVGVDPHKRTLTATVVDPRGGIVASEHFRVSGDGHRELEAWARQFGPIARWGIEGSASWGRHTAMFLIGRGYDVRDVCAEPHAPVMIARASAASQTRWTPSGSRARCSLTRCCPRRSSAPGRTQGPDEQHQLLALWNNRRRSILTSRQHLVDEAEPLLCELPLELREQLPDSKAVTPTPRGAGRAQPPPALRRADHAAPAAARRLPARRSRRWTSRRSRSSRSSRRSCAQSGSTLERALRPEHPVGRRAAGRGRRPPPVHRRRVRALQRHRALPASTAEGPGEPVRHRYNPGGNRRVNAILHRMAVTQLRCEPRAQRIYANARANGPHQEGGPPDPQAPPL